MPIVEKHGDSLIVMGKKHLGKTIEQVAKEDPNYLTWLKSGDRLTHVSDEVFFAIGAIMDAFGIPHSPRHKK